MNCDEILPYLNERFLYHALWQIGADAFLKDSELKKELADKYLQMSQWAREIVAPTHRYGFYRAVFTGHQAEIYDTHEAASLMTISHAFDSIPAETIAFQIVTLGQSAVEKAQELKNNDEYSDYFYWHGFCAALTEAFAAKIHAVIREEYSKERSSPEAEFDQTYHGSRLSFGYPALPSIMEQGKVLELLHAEDMGIIMTESGMLTPEYSTCAMVIFE